MNHEKNHESNYTRNNTRRITRKIPRKNTRGVTKKIIRGIFRRKIKEIKENKGINLYRVEIRFFYLFLQFEKKKMKVAKIENNFF